MMYVFLWKQMISARNGVFVNAALTKNFNLDFLTCKNPAVEIDTVGGQNICNDCDAIRSLHVVSALVYRFFQTT